MIAAGRVAVIAQGADVATFALCMAIGIPLAAEANPLTVALVASGGLLGLALVKIGAPMLMAHRHRRHGHTWPTWFARSTGLVMVALIVSGTIGAVFNLAAAVLWMTA